MFGIIPRNGNRHPKTKAIVVDNHVQRYDNRHRNYESFIDCGNGVGNDLELAETDQRRGNCVQEFVSSIERQDA
jgi:hypothetical protein